MASLGASEGACSRRLPECPGGYGEQDVATGAPRGPERSRFVSLQLAWGGADRHPSVGEAEQAMVTPEVVSSVVGAPWSMRWLDGIGRESWDWGVPHVLASPSFPP